MMEPCGLKHVHAAHHYVAADSNGYWCQGVREPASAHAIAGLRVIPPAEAARWLADPEHVAFDSLDLYSAAHTIAGEPGRLARAAQLAAAAAWDDAYDAAALGVQKYHNPHRPHRNLGACPEWCTSNGVPS